MAPEARLPERHPLRPIRVMVDQALAALDAEFEALYSHTGRPSIPPEYLLRATPLQILYSVRSERLLVEQIDYNLLFRWLIVLSMDAPVWDHSTFTKNRDWLLEAALARASCIRCDFVCASDRRRSKSSGECPLSNILRNTR
jgi:transposase